MSAALEDMGRHPSPWADWMRWAVIGLVVLACLLLLRSLVKLLRETMNPPQPAYAQVVAEEVAENDPDEQVYVEAVRVNELLQRLETMTKAEPGGFAKLVRSWLQEGSAAASGSGAKKGH